MKKHFPSIIFFIVLIVTYYCLGFSDVLDKRPQSVHAWAMCDRASVARNYAEESMNFFKPRTNFTQGGTGISGLEFPFMNYMAAICYRLFDFHEFWYRLLVLIAVTSGLVAAFHLSGHFLKNNFFSGLIVLAFFLSPVLNYYSISFLPDAASLGFILLMWLGFFNYQKKPKADPLILFFIFGALAALIKITSLISLIVILILLVFDKLKWLHTERKKIFIKHNVFIVLVLIIFILVFAWYDYARWLNDFYKCPIFLMSNNTPKTWEEAKEVWEGIKLTWIPFYYPSLIYYLILITGISLIISHRKVNRLTGTITLLLWMGNFCFVSLMFNQYRSHDYYIIALLPAVFFQFITAFEMYFRIVQKKKYFTFN